LPLPAKVKRSGAIIRAAIDTGRAVLSFSGGRDSVAMALIVRRIAPGLPWVYVDTGLADPRLAEFIRAFGGSNLTYLRNPTPPSETWQAEGCLPIGAKVSAESYRRDLPELRIGPKECCQRHKARPMNRWLKERKTTALIVGARGDDSTRHAFKLQTGEIFPGKHGYHLAYPLLVWRQRDTLEFLAATMPDYPLAYARNEELGCRACAINLARWPNQMQKLRQSDPDYHRRLMVEEGFGLQILQIKYRTTEAGARQIIDRDGWDSLIDSGALDRIPHPRKGWR